MVIPDEIRKCVGFIGYQKVDGSISLAGTVFFLGKKMGTVADRVFLYAVTARHVIDGIKNKGIDMVLLRLNRKGTDSVWVRTMAKDWLSSPDPSIDVAAIGIGLDASWDHLFFPVEGSATSLVIEQKKIDVGDEVCIAGLFAHHVGRKRNIPIVRTGNIAAMPHEKVATGLGEIDAYLIEARSIGGLSGSPVFVNPTGVRHGILTLTDGPQLFLLGLVHGHFDTRSLALDATADAPGVAGINTGIGIVVPVEKILEVLSQPVFRSAEEALEKRLRSESLPKMD